MRLEQKIAAIILTATTISISSFGLGVLSQKKEIAALTKQIDAQKESLQMIKENNYKLHLDLIKKGNPYNWELFGDTNGNWGYRLADENVILGATNCNYEYLGKK